MNEVGVRLWVEEYVFDCGGHLLSQKTSPAHSWVKQVAQLWYNRFINTESEAIKDTSGSTVGQPTNTNPTRSDAAANDDAYGILAGTGVGAESSEDYALGTKIAHGIGAGQLSYGATTNTTGTITGGKRFTVSRTFTNLSGASITIQEVGLAVLQDTKYYLWIRDLTGGTAVGNGQSAAYAYRMDYTI